MNKLNNYFYAALISLMSFQPFMFLLGLIPHKNPIEDLFIYIIAFLGTLHFVLLFILFAVLYISKRNNKTIKNYILLKKITLFLIIFNIIILSGPSFLRKERNNQIQLFKYRIEELLY